MTEKKEAAARAADAGTVAAQVLNDYGLGSPQAGAALAAAQTAADAATRAGATRDDILAARRNHQ